MHNNISILDFYIYFHVQPNANQFDTWPNTIRIDLSLLQILPFVVRTPVPELFLGLIAEFKENRLDLALERFLLKILDLTLFGFKQQLTHRS